MSNPDRISFITKHFCWSILDMTRKEKDFNKSEQTYDNNFSQSLFSSLELPIKYFMNEKSYEMDRFVFCN